MSGRFALKLQEFNRIYQVIHGTIVHEVKAEKSCVFFAIAGSYLLNKHFKIGARPVAGGFILRPWEAKQCVGFVKEKDGKWAWGDDAFHMWVETKDHIIDFMSPIYREAFEKADPTGVLPRKMFQKRKDQESSDPNVLSEIGAFFTFPDPEMTEEIIDHFCKSATRTDLLQIIDAWFGARSQKQKTAMSMRSDDGGVFRCSLPSTIATGGW